jgi:hypothetical protein
MTHRLYHNRRMPKRTRFLSFIYKGFKVTVVNTNLYGFPYEWEITPVTPLARAKVKTSGTVFDPTSWRTRAMARRTAISYIEDMRMNFMYMIDAMNFNKETS